ncbi:YggS family pyridoxal phosphate enzyme [Rhodococcus sp. CUA-806]|jgi:pyridoxal phosphate enzyme (YggS family)|nr:YggS family pyridoxal phosphate enzyme [Rhodococcus sp. CUA-806]OLT31956.1 YggS family pyridoxal phosphate enzyme [Rhodococcus sp. CUA-806]OLT34975.1 YggS family pyridoxal phosphate enzyme [Rhodococcus sp. CUA-806]
MPSVADALSGPEYPPAATIDDLARNIASVRNRIAASAERSGRDASGIRLLPVSKTVAEDRIRWAVEAGCRELGENKVQEAKRKHENLADINIRWSVIGHLQTNKARDVAAFAAEFQALDSLRVAEVLDRRLQALGRSLDVYVQVNTSGEESKYGLVPADVPDFLSALPRYSALKVRGFMTLALFTAHTPRVRECFRLLRTVRDRARETDPGLIGPGELSMGMSGDYEVAIEEGSNCVRVGQAIFGARATENGLYWPTLTPTNH